MVYFDEVKIKVIGEVLISYIFVFNIENVLLWIKMDFGSDIKFIYIVCDLIERMLFYYIYYIMRG